MAKAKSETLDKPTHAPSVSAKAEPVFGDRVIRMSLVPTRGHDGTVVKLIKDFPHSPWSESVQENWGLLIDAGEQEHPIAAVTLNLLKQRQEVNLSPLNIEDMPMAIEKYTLLGWSVEHGPEAQTHA